MGVLEALPTPALLTSFQIPQAGMHPSPPVFSAASSGMGLVLWTGGPQAD